MPDPERCPRCFDPLPADTICPCADEADREHCPSALPVGTVLNHLYRIGRVLGRHGGFGITYLGWHEKLAIKVAIKEYFPREIVSRTDSHRVRPQLNRDRAPFTDGRDRFLEEARILARFSHPNIVRVRSYFEANETAYLVMDYYEGQTLAQYLDQLAEPMSGPDALALVDGIAAGLARVHERGFLHRDLKPQNIYLTASGIPVLLDFGAARIARPDESRSRSILLTPGYAPIEQYHRRGKQGPWTDVYGLAATLYTMVTGTTPPDAVERSYQDTLIPPRQLAPALDAQLEAAILAGLAVDHRHRPQSMSDFRLMLEGKRPAPRTAPPPVRIRWSRWRLGRWIGIAAILALAIGYGLRHWSEPVPAGRTPDRDTIRSLLAEESRLMDEARRQEQDAAYRKAIGLNTESALTEYLQEYGPTAVYYGDARKRLNRIIADDVAYQAARERNTIAAYQAYLNLFGEDGVHSLEARKAIQALQSPTGKRANTPDRP